VTADHAAIAALLVLVLGSYTVWLRSYVLGHQDIHPGIGIVLTISYIVAYTAAYISFCAFFAWTIGVDPQ
jgi:hypothetical protein